jgi:dephospho-CoA kinase
MNKPFPNNKPLIIALTGGIGAGKSVIAQLFAVLGIPVYDADTAAKSILESDPNVVAAVKAIFGAQAYKDGEPDRAFLASRIFGDDGLRKQLNAIVHPAVAYDFLQWKDAHSMAPYIIKEAAISIETGLYKEADCVVLVTAPEHVRIERVMIRNKITAAEVEKRIRSQWTDEKKLPFADYVVKNDGVHAIIPQTLHIHHTILQGLRPESPTFEKNQI